MRGGDKGPAGTDEANTTVACFRIPELAVALDGSLPPYAGSSPEEKKFDQPGYILVPPCLWCR